MAPTLTLVLTFELKWFCGLVVSVTGIPSLVLSRAYYCKVLCHVATKFGSVIGPTRLKWDIFLVLMSSRVSRMSSPGTGPLNSPLEPTLGIYI